MKYKLINIPDKSLNPQEQILFNRGIPVNQIQHYLHLTDEDIFPPETLGEEVLKGATNALLETIEDGGDIYVIIDCDCDGYTSGVIMINYIYDLTNKDYIEKHVKWFMHEGKQHGLSDCIDVILDADPDLVIIPDAGSNDVEYIKQLREALCDVIILDHHELEVKPYEDCYLINSQLRNYPNTFLSGAGVVYQFCRFIDKETGNNYADWYLDLCATGLDGDMMSLLSTETRRLITKGLEPDNIHNPFLYGMWQKNMFKLGEHPTAWGFTFYIVPFINAITRSGTQEEKELVFNSMLKFKANDLIPSTKRGCKGQTETVVEQAVRTCTNVKNRQGKAETAGMELVEHLIQDNNMFDHKVLVFLLEPGQIKAEIRGLVANKIMAKYQRPCCMLTKRVQQLSGGDIPNPLTGIITTYAGGEKVTYEGSARGCDKVGVTEFKDICAATQVVDYVAGHQGAFGLGISAENIDEFVFRTDSALVDMPDEPVYYVDFIWNPTDNFGQDILDIAKLEKYIGKDFAEPLVVVQNVEITKDNIQMMKSNTVKITLPNGVSMIRFNMSDKEFNQLYSENGSVMIDVIGKCTINEWLGNEYPQIKIESYNITKRNAYIF